MLFILFFITLISHVTSHGFLCEPPSRNAAWLCGYPQDEPKNYDQMSLNAGGVWRTYPDYPNRCPVLYGVCGDQANTTQNHAAGGVHDRGVRREYRRGDNIQIQVNITAYHKGHFEIELCPTYPESEDCFESISQFSIEDTSLEGGNPTYYFDVDLPANTTCDRCVLRWFWVTNNSPGLPPEFFINCADISIT